MCICSIGQMKNQHVEQKKSLPAKPWDVLLENNTLSKLTEEVREHIRSYSRLHKWTYTFYTYYTYDPLISVSKTQDVN